jgi:hypothetical protein
MHGPRRKKRERERREISGGRDGMSKVDRYNHRIFLLFVFSCIVDMFTKTGCLQSPAAAAAI